MNEEVMERQERSKEVVVVFIIVLFGGGVVLIFVCLLTLFCFLWGSFRCEGRIWEDQEVSIIGVHDVKLPKNQ